MLLTLLFIFAICYLIEITETHYLPNTYYSKYATANNREDLMKIIKSLNYHENGRNIEEPVNELNDEEKEKKLQNILWLIQKNYNAQKHFESSNNNYSATRLYLIKNPSVLEDYKNHLYQIRRSGKVKTKNYIDQHKNLKNQLRKMRRGAVFRLGSSESESEYIDKKYVSNVKVNDMQVQANNPISNIQEREEVQDFNNDKIEEYPELKDSLELHNTKVHNNLRTDYEFRREKKYWDERHENPDTVETGKKKKNAYRYQPSHKEDTFKIETVNWDKITTKDYPIKYKNKKAVKDLDYDIKPSYNRPQKKNMNKDFHSYGRTSIPFVGKRGIYDEK